MESLLSFLLMAQNTNTVYTVLHLALFTFILSVEQYASFFYSLMLITSTTNRKATDSVSQ